MAKIDFNKDWIFKKSGEEKGESIILPHDAMLHEEREPSNQSGSAGAYFSGGVYEYEKKFDVPKEWDGMDLILEFEGVYQNAVLYLNEVEVAKIVYGYIPSQIILNSFLQYGVENHIRVIADNQKVPNSRWYSGAGIYRPVWMHVLEPCHIDLNGIKVKTLSYSPAKISISVSHIEGTVTTRIFDQEHLLVEKSGNDIEITIDNANLWSDETPYLYTCQVELKKNGIVTDIKKVSFGIRKIEWSTKGLLVNGKETLLRGGCVHHDNGILGACTYDETENRRVKIMKEVGFNAIRSSHNPCSRAMLEACDKYGMYMIDETWDMWFQHKSKYDYASAFLDHYKEDIKKMVDKDYNHPSVIFYSIGNEVSEPASKMGMKIAKEMIEYLHMLDDSRAVTAGLNLMIVANSAKGKNMYNAEEGGLNQDSSKKMSNMNSTMFNMLTQVVGPGMNRAANSNKADRATSPILDALDVAGYNYATGRYSMEGKKHPNRIIYGSETFPQDLAKNWKMVEKYPYLIGDFMWTAWDYLGEAGLGAWSYDEEDKVFNKPYPWILGGAGVIDSLGEPGGEALHAKAIWGLNKEIGIAVRPINHPGEKIIKSSWRGTNAIPSWSWKNCEGNQAVIEIYTKAEFVVLLLNGEKIGRKKTKNSKCIFKTKYKDGVLEAIGYDKEGNCIERGVLKSAKGDLRICIRPEKEKIVPNELLYVNVDICGENGVTESNADDNLEMHVLGGELLGFGSANPKTKENYLDGKFTTYFGKALAVIRVGEDAALKISVKGLSMLESELII